MSVDFISPTKQYENEVRNPEKHQEMIKFKYDEKREVMLCSEGAELKKEEEYFNSRKQTKMMRFSNKDACLKCSSRDKCTTSKDGYRKVKLSERASYQNQMQEKYKSERGQEIYKKRSHTAETFQGDLKQNGKFIQLFRRGRDKVKLDSITHDIIWNLRRIFNCTNGFA